MAGAALPVLPRLPRAMPTVALGGVDVQPRSAWGADLKPKGPLSEEAAGDVRFLLVHHTASGNSYGRGEVPRLLRGFYALHTTDGKWADIAYGFLVDRFGRVWEGRSGSLSGPVKADATGGSQGFAVLACFIGDHRTQPPSADALDAMGKLLGALAGRHGIDVRPGTMATFVSRGSNLHPAGKQVTTPTISAHRDMSKTACPGDACYRLLRTTLVPAAVAARGAVVAAPPTVTPSLPTEPATPAGPPPTAPGETLPAANPGGAPLDTSPAPSVGPLPPTFLGGADEASGDASPPTAVVAGAAGGAVLAAGGLVALLMRRRGNARESGDWQQARRSDEPAD